ncbi:GNAT family N-acetyltransferase [Sporosarcina trichiuri]|uniref:GNAT family N-acetyltransferase n=1 Tax=Sporosarcina trichiuri TaxID=3056445 RepID=UPI0025B4A2E5|nr:GNAT family N-acetyltransferase [Sporosarcina sp. 0.2-SM1T-5]WJY27300.1 GNAT family N-acetyltransferase [Sporosarcina sp. 0.2-SM1T-5]
MEFVNIEGMPDTQTVQKMLRIHEQIFRDSENLLNKARSKPNLLFTLALENDEVTGYKIGYKLDDATFYSWLGGVGEAYRGRGIASGLMRHQHHFLVEKGYSVVRTKTMNKWRSMLILNLKQGFDITGICADKNGEIKIILEKRLYPMSVQMEGAYEN